MDIGDFNSMDSAPRDGTRILLLYEKIKSARHSTGRGRFITEAYWQGNKFEWDKELRRAVAVNSSLNGAWLDYAGRLLQSVPSKSGNCALGWLPLQNKGTD